MQTRSYTWVFFFIAAAVAAGCQTQAAQPPTSGQIISAGQLGPQSAILYVSNGVQNSVSGFFETDNGNVAPHILIAGPHTQIHNFAGALSVDHNGVLYVLTAGNQINVYAPGANGDVSPSAVITCAAPSPTNIIALDGSKIITGASPDSRGCCLAIFNSANGCAANSQFITGPHTGVNSPDGIAVDRAGSIYAAQAAWDFCCAGVAVFDSTAAGDTAPKRFITGGFGFFHPGGLALDSQERIFVPLYDGNSILVFARDANGNANPLLTLCGPSSGLNLPDAIAIGRNNKIYVPNSGNNTVTVYPANLNGPLKPVQVLSGSNTGLRDLRGVALFEP